MSDSESLKKKQKMGDKENAMPMDDSSVGENGAGLDATALNRFSRQNAALGTYCLPAKLSSDTHCVCGFFEILNQKANHSSKIKHSPDRCRDDSQANQDEGGYCRLQRGRN